MAKKNFKPITDKEYRKSFAHCPWCNSGNTEGQSVDIDSNGASQEMLCLDCGKYWMDLYKLSGYMPLEDYNEVQ